jgi:hypothetical protein
VKSASSCNGQPATALGHTGARYVTAVHGQSAHGCSLHRDWTACGKSALIKHEHSTPFFPSIRTEEQVYSIIVHVEPLSKVLVYDLSCLGSPVRELHFLDRFLEVDGLSFCALSPTFLNSFKGLINLNRLMQLNALVRVQGAWSSDGPAAVRDKRKSASATYHENQREQNVRGVIAARTGLAFLPASSCLRGRALQTQTSTPVTSWMLRQCGQLEQIYNSYMKRRKQFDAHGGCANVACAVQVPSPPTLWGVASMHTPVVPSSSNSSSVM